MKTKRLISTISYNSEQFLQSLLDSMVSDGVIEYWYAILHQPEDDETKEHFHLIVQPSFSIDTNSFRHQFEELDPNNPLPRSCMPFRPSKSFADWYLYAVHHKGYLMWKGEVRKHSYTFYDFIGSDLDLLQAMVNECDIQKYRCYEMIYLAAERKVPFSMLVAEGHVPIGLINQFRTLYECIIDDSVTYRGCRVGHEGIIHDGKDPFNSA